MKRLIILLTVVIFISCNSAPKKEYKLKIVEVYLTDVDANDGVVEKNWRTVVETQDKTRDIISGKYGKVGDVFIMLRGNGYWEIKE